MEKLKLSNDLSVSRIVHGQMRLNEWNLSKTELLRFINELIEIGITTFDHADIYGDYTCEKIFGDALKNQNSLRNNIQIITKCGIKLKSDKFPQRTIKHYDYSYSYIISSVENSIKHFEGYVDLLLLHRPSPFFNPEEVAKAFYDLKKSGKVLNFGVSNFLPHQFEMLNSYLDEKLTTNQIEISPLYLEHFKNGNIEFLQKERITPMSWSPVAGGRIFNPKTKTETNIFKTLNQLAKELRVSSIETLVYAWLLQHPAKIIPVVGSGKLDRIKNAIKALDLKLTTEQWFQIYTSAVGTEVP